MTGDVVEMRPSHVPPELVRDFDFYDFPGSSEDVQAAFASIQQSSPDIFWTPRNGGHWVATRTEDVMEMLKDYQRFSVRQLVIPPFPPDTPPFIPSEIDPPQHRKYRRPLMQYLVPSAICDLEVRVRRIAIEIIENIAPNGECEFVSEFAKVLPIVVYMSMVNLPMDDVDYLVATAEGVVRGETSEIRRQSQIKMTEYMVRWVRERREKPGEDLLSMAVNVDIDGERISEPEAISYASALLFGGLDTVAGMMSFIALFLARNPGHRHQLTERINDHAFVKNAIEELIRRHGLANDARVITGDFEYKGIQFKTDERILPSTTFVGLDDRVTSNPLEVDFERARPIHAAFGYGDHTCPGQHLARREIRVFLEEWLPRIPNFHVKPGTTPVLSSGAVSGVQRLKLAFG
jgi:cytochrome P450